jgi:hypothetical protein
MDTTIIGAIVGASAVIITTIVTTFNNSKIASKTREYEREKELMKFNQELQKMQMEKSRTHYERAHSIISTLEREFSLTSITIDWGAKLTVTQWDEKYKSLCKLTDELRMIASLLGDSIASPVEKIDGQMNVYWGYFRNFLYLMSQGDDVDHRTSGHKEAFAAAREIQQLSSEAKQALKAKITMES